ncbi:hypothetical protein V6N13_049256 [Hibiscus sabdariffa]|uniref:DUF4408 domain-containing protein n=1 Tax=Hibiscus sabdariffa TaxID=183260 RepID=A0ABR2QY28_9ROSI
MDSSELIDNIMAEKEDALWRYNMEKNLRFGLQFSGFLLALFFTSRSTLIPDIVHVAGDLRLRFINTLDEPLSIFVFLNIIILVVYVLSSRKQSDIYDEYVGSRRSILTTPAVAEETTVEKQIALAENAVAVTETERSSAEETTVDKQIVPVENAVTVAETKRSLSPLKHQQQQQLSTTTSLTVIKPEPVIISTDEVKQKGYRRTRSVVSESGNQRRLRGFKRSETVMMGRELVVSRTEPARKSLDEMSNEEFRLIVDNFIAERRKTLIQENCMTIVVKN